MRLVHSNDYIEVYDDDGVIFLRNKARESTFVEIRPSLGTKSGIYFLNHYRLNLEIQPMIQVSKSLGI